MTTIKTTIMPGTITTMPDTGATMRQLLMVLALIALPGPAVAADNWDSYLNARFGYEIAVPPGFTCAAETDNGDGRVCRAGSQMLTIYGGYTNVIDDNGFAGEVAFDLNADQRAGWTITYKSTTPDWASYSGTKGKRVLYVREIAGCAGTQFATFRLNYPSTDINALKPVVSRLVGSLKQKICGE